MKKVIFQKKETTFYCLYLLFNGRNNKVCGLNRQILLLISKKNWRSEKFIVMHYIESQIFKKI
jgi:hypothetical protein